MQRFLKLVLVVVVIAALTGSSIYLYANTQNNANSDTTPPIISFVTGNTTAFTGKTVQIKATFSDDIEVTNATLNYRKAGEKNWTSTSLLNGSALIAIPRGLAVNYEYYVLVEDAAGNQAGSPSSDGSTFYVITVKQQNVSLAHHVFIEEATYTGCVYCPAVADALHALEAENKAFSYIAYVDDMSSDAEARTTAYNVKAYPALFVDGGYKILVGTQTKETIAAAIAEAANRSVPALQLIITATNTSSTATITVNITSYTDATYTGTLRVFNTDRNSWAYHGGTGIYHYGLTKILANETITIQPFGQWIKNYTITGNTTDFDNTAILAALYSRSGTKEYSNPSGASEEEKGPFTAYFIDASNATLIVPGGNLPPEVGITFPVGNTLNLMNRHILTKFKPKVTLCLGRPTITVKATDNDSGIARVELYLDGNLVKNFTAEPFSWKWPMTKPSLGIRTHTVTAIAYDAKGKNATTSLTLRVLGL